MPIYSKTISDEEIMRLIKPDYKMVLILACAGCMNESISFDTGLPIIKTECDHKSFPALESECSRISDYLSKHGIATNIRILPSGSNSGCIVNLDEPHYPIPADSTYDAVLVLSCPAGFFDISKIIDSLPIFIISRQIGMLNYRYFDDGCRRVITHGKISPF